VKRADPFYGDLRFGIDLGWLMRGFGFQNVFGVYRPKRQPTQDLSVEAGHAQDAEVSELILQSVNCLKYEIEKQKLARYGKEKVGKAWTVFYDVLFNADFLENEDFQILFENSIVLSAAYYVRYPSADTALEDVFNAYFIQIGNYYQQHKDNLAYPNHLFWEYRENAAKFYTALKTLETAQTNVPEPNEILYGPFTQLCKNLLHDKLQLKSSSADSIDRQPTKSKPMVVDKRVEMAKSSVHIMVGAVRSSRYFSLSELKGFFESQQHILTTVLVKGYGQNWELQTELRVAYRELQVEIALYWEDAKFLQAVKDRILFDCNDKRLPLLKEGIMPSLLKVEAALQAAQTQTNSPLPNSQSPVKFTGAPVPVLIVPGNRPMQQSRETITNGF